VLSELGPATDQLLVESRDLLQRDDWRQQILEDDVRSKFEPLISQIDQLIKVSSHSPQTFLHAAATHALYLTAVNTHCRGYVFVCAQRLTKPSQPKDDAELLLELLQFFIYQAYLVGLVAVNQHLPAEEQQLEDDATTRDIMARLQQASLVDGVREQMVSAQTANIHRVLFFLLFVFVVLLAGCEQSKETSVDTTQMSMDTLRDEWNRQMTAASVAFKSAHKIGQTSLDGSPTGEEQLMSGIKFYVRRCLKAKCYLDALEQRFYNWLEVRSCCCCSARFARSVLVCCYYSVD